MYEYASHAPGAWGKGVRKGVGFSRTGGVESLGWLPTPTTLFLTHIPEPEKTDYDDDCVVGSLVQPP